MNLLLENGQLLKPCSIPWSRGKWVRPKGWTPQRTPQMTIRFEELSAERDDIPDAVLWGQVEHEEGERRQAARRPWPGWVMVPGPSMPSATKTDRRISKSYRRLFSELNEQYSDFIDNGRQPPAGAELVQVPDGQYEFRRGRMMQC